MRVLAILTILPFVVTTPALAQSAEPQQSNASGAQAIQQQVQNNLQQAGFTDIQIMPSSFLVRAKDRAGNPVMMVINPDSVTAVTDVTGGDRAASAPSAAPGGGEANVPSVPNSGAGIPGKPGSKSGPAMRPPSATTGSGANPDNQRSGNQDAAKVPGLPGSKSGPAASSPASK